MKIYIVQHVLDVDGGFGDAVTKEEKVAAFSSREDAEDFVKKYEFPNIYDRPYANLWQGYLAISEMGVVSHQEYPSYKCETIDWLPTPELPEEFDGDYLCEGCWELEGGYCDGKCRLSCSSAVDNWMKKHNTTIEDLFIEHREWFHSDEDDEEDEE